MSGRFALALFVLSGWALALVLALNSASIPAVLGEEEAKYIGSSKCKMCHSEQHQVWESKKHSKAWDALPADKIESGKDEKGRACVQCHTTGYGAPGGFISAEKTPKRKGVGCESCHGAGSLHGKEMLKFVMTEIEPEDKKISKSGNCGKCHDPHVDHKKLYGPK